MIEVNQFSKAYDAMVAVADLSFCVQPGEILGLVGPNGAGKTTTLRALAGIIPSSAGKIQIAGFDMDREPIAVKQRTAYVPDDPQLFHDLTVEQHLAFTASMYAVQDAVAKTDALLTSFALAPKRHTRASDLSRGMRQKLAICCAYLYEPQALLLDEPMTGLDPQGIRTLKQSVLQWAKRGSAVIISSHLLAMVEDICTHVLILESGQNKYCGTLDDLRASFAAPDTQTSLEDIFFRAVGDTSTDHVQLSTAVTS